jgi:signal transduction histidine kinase
VSSSGELQRDRVNLDRLVAEMIEHYPSFQPPQAEVQVDRPLLPVFGHEASLNQCISNLVANAVKFVPPGTVPRVRVWTEPRDTRVRLWVEDNGIGISEENQKRIFEIFVRVHPDKTFPGTGIGLSIVRKAVERMGGTVGLESQLGHGSRFWIELPKA